MSAAETESPAQPAGVETPSGKGAGDENFPVASWLLPPHLRPHVMRFYAFARAADDIADNATLTPEQKIARLDRFEAGVTGAAPDDPEVETAHRCWLSLRETQVPPQHCVDLLAAFKQDAVKRRYSDWEDLMGYCRLSASPVGRYLLDVHGEDPAGYAASDPLCDALQVLNHLQDCADDYRELDRVYVPEDWLRAEGLGVEALAEPAASPALRRVLDRCLDHTDALIARCRPLPARLRSRRLAMESATIVSVASQLSAELRRHDPIAGRVELGKAQMARAFLAGLVEGMRRHPRQAAPSGQSR